MVLKKVLLGTESHQGHQLLIPDVESYARVQDFLEVVFIILSLPKSMEWIS